MTVVQSESANIIKEVVMSESTKSTNLRIATEADAQPQQEKPEKQESTRPNKPVPTARISCAKQMDILRAYGAVSGPTSKVIVSKDIAEIVEMSASTLPLANPFFVDCKLLSRAEGQGMSPAAELLEYA